MAAIFKGILSNISLYAKYYAKACNELAGLTSVSMCSGNTAPFEEISHWWRAVGNTVFNLTGPRFNLKPPASETNALLLDQLAANWFTSLNMEHNLSKNLISKKEMKLNSFLNNFRKFFPYVTSWQLYNKTAV